MSTSASKQRNINFEIPLYDNNKYESQINAILPYWNNSFNIALPLVDVRFGDKSTLEC